jgi:hypothetical protein
MTTRRILGRGRGNTQWVSSGPARRRILQALLAAATSGLAAFSSSGTLSAAGGGRGGSPAAAAAGSLKTATIGGATVLTNANGFTLEFRPFRTCRV